MRWIIGALVATLTFTLIDRAEAQAFDAAQAANYCTAEGAFGERFGASGVNGVPGVRMMNSQFVTPAQAYAFSEIEATFTHLSHRLHTISAMASFADADAAVEAYDALDEALASRFQYAGVNDLEDGIAYYSGDPATETGFKVEIMLMGDDLQFTCTDRALFQLTMDEFTGRARVAGPPAPPQLTLPPAPAAGACAAPESRAALLSGFEGQIGAIMNYGTEANRYSETLANWKRQLMQERGLWTEQESRDFHLAMLNDDGFRGHTQTSMNALMAMIGQLQAMEQAPDETARCGRAVDALGAARTLVSSAEANWRFMDEMYEAEARRRVGSAD